jgi:dTDP-4-amino-4,6-dideoxygalactose transaminase
MFGFMADMYQIRQESHGLKIIEDSCETMGTRFIDGFENNPFYTGDRRNKSCGSFGDIGCFSTYACHLIVTGVGGIAITKNPVYEQLMRSYANHGRDPYFLGGYSQENKKPSLELIQKRFLYHRVGYSSRVSEFEAALGIAQLDRLNATLTKRQRNATLLERLLWPARWNGGKGFLQLPPVIPINRSHAFMMFPIVIKDESIDRDLFCLYLERHGVETRPLMPLLMQPIYKTLFGDISEKYPVAHEATTRGFYVGCHQKLEAKDIEYLANTIQDAVTTLSRKKTYVHA